jgi:hypothetical protein
MVCVPAGVKSTALNDAVPPEMVAVPRARPVVVSRKTTAPVAAAGATVAVSDVAEPSGTTSGFAVTTTLVAATEITTLAEAVVAEAA